MEDNKFKKNPIGIEPKWVWEETRLNNLDLAIARYYNENIEIPIEWVEERNGLIKSVRSPILSAKR